MIISYRGHEIRAERQRSLGGDIFCYFSIVRESDQYICEESFSGDTVRYMVKYLKRLVDLQLARDGGPAWGEWDERWDQEFSDV